MPAYATVPIPQINAGTHTVQMTYADGQIEKKDIIVEPNKTVQVDFSYKFQSAPTTAWGTGQNTVARPGTGLPNGLTYTTGRKVGAGFLNFVAGVGSFTMGDWIGGLIVGGTEALGLGLIIVGMIGNAYEDDGSEWFADFGSRFEAEPNIGLLVSGLLIGAAGEIYGYIRPFQYDKSLSKKNGTYYASNNPMDHIHIAVIPNNKGIRAVNMSYSFKF
jgi:hypothetical protein